METLTVEQARLKLTTKCGECTTKRCCYCCVIDQLLILLAKYRDTPVTLPELVSSLLKGL